MQDFFSGDPRVFRLEPTSSSSTGHLHSLGHLFHQGTFSCAFCFPDTQIPDGGRVSISPWEGDAHGPLGGAKSRCQPRPPPPPARCPGGVWALEPALWPLWGVLRSPSSTLPSAWHFRWTSALACRGDCSSHCPRYLLIEGWKDLTTLQSGARALQGPERTQNSSTCQVSFPFPFPPRPAAFHPVTWGSFSTPVVALVAQHSHLSFRPSSPGPHLPRVQPSKASPPAWLTSRNPAPPVFCP